MYYIVLLLCMHNYCKVGIFHGGEISRNHDPLVLVSKLHPQLSTVYSIRVRGEPGKETRSIVLQKNFMR